MGQALAQKCHREFVDTDQLLEAETGMRLQQIVDLEGRSGMLAREHQLLLNLETGNKVVATGGSAIYHEAAMQHLAAQASIVLLDIDYETLVERMPNYQDRGVAREQGQSLESLYAERLPLYTRYAEYRIACGREGGEPGVERVVEQILLQLEL